jgi:hypothetical protein
LDPNTPLDPNFVISPYSGILVRHLPSQLSDDDKEELFTHFGAVRVKVMGTKGAMVRKRYSSRQKS